MELSWEKVSPFLSPQATLQKARVEAYLPVLQVRLNTRYGDRITENLEPVFSEIVAEAIMRRLERGSRGIRRQSVGGASVEYDPRMPLTSWFTAEELSELDSLTGMGGARTVRMPAPYGQRFGNLYQRHGDDA